MSSGDGPATAGAGPLIGAAGLASLASLLGPPGDPKPGDPSQHRSVTLLDVRWQLGGPPGMQRYLAGHLPGAVYVDLDADLAAPPGTGAGGRHPLPAPDAFAAAMRRAGLCDGQLAVVYDDGDATVAARLWWLLRYSVTTR